MKPSAHKDSVRRAIGIVRVSVTGGREGERFVSPEDQRDRIEAACARDGLTLLDVHEELDVSGGKSLADRPGLSAAVAAIENGKAEVVAAGYFDRLFRSLSTQAEVIERVERAGGQVLAVDVGQVTHESAGQWLSASMMGAVSEYVRRSAKERSAEGQARAVARGAVPWSRVPLGYTRRDDGTLDPNPSDVPIVREAFEMRAAGASHGKIRDWLKSRGIERSHRGVQVMLANRAYLGEIHFGQYVNLSAHEPIIERELFNRVQRMVVPRGRRSDSARLLARLGVLRCGSCGARMSAMKLPKQGDYPIYRCPSTSDCPKHVTISATIAEEVVFRRAIEGYLGMTGRASMAEQAREVIEERDRAQAKVTGLVRAFATANVQDDPAAVEAMADAKQELDEWQERVERLEPQTTAQVFDPAVDADDMSPEGKRALIKAAVRSAVVVPGGRGAERITVELFGE